MGMDPLLELRTLELYSDSRWAAAEQHWRRYQHVVPPAEPIPLRDWWALMVEIVAALWLALRQADPPQTQPVTCETFRQRLSLGEIRAMPLHQSSQAVEHFSVN